MQKFLPTILAILLLTACAQTSVEPSNEISKEDQTTDNFERNLECQKFKEDLQEEFLEINGRGVDGLFFSSKTNSCLFTITLGGMGGDYQEFLYDFFTREVLEFSNYNTTRKNFEEKIIMFDNKVAEYQN